ncbi:hypothetical protein ACQ86N_42290 [Puia sp. P3]|uniref:hypothetical protein n=1 Tax=Puia sp. P3 TaxID=3423952 RepID=UPI003D678C15
MVVIIKVYCYLEGIPILSFVTFTPSAMNSYPNKPLAEFTEGEKYDIVNHELALLPYFGSDMSKHISVIIGPMPVMKGQASEVMAIQYRLLSDLQNQKGAKERIEDTLNKAGAILRMPVTTY